MDHEVNKLRVFVESRLSEIAGELEKLRKADGTFSDRIFSDADLRDMRIPHSIIRVKAELICFFPEVLPSHLEVINHLTVRLKLFEELFDEARRNQRIKEFDAQWETFRKEKK
ncbi:MAG: hypothetical protein HY422_02275 [Candidatus Komeilibacteria bacterium]|nr:hypothetical protein [Candidatus Komeilibacteria bacterium]